MAGYWLAQVEAGRARETGAAAAEEAGRCVARLTDCNARCPQDLRTICTCSPSLLHTREFRCCDRANGPQRIGGLVRLRQASRVASEEAISCERSPSP